MPHIFYKNGISYVKKHKKQGLLFGFVFIFLMCFLIFNMSDLISSAVTNSKSIFFQNKIEIPSYSAYAVSVAETQSEEETSNLSFQVKNLGGAGVVYNNGLNFLIFASIYPNLNQAKEVEQNLALLGNNCKILTFDVEYISKKNSSKNIQKITNCIKYFKTIFKSLCDISFKFDKGETISKAKNDVKVVLNVLMNNCLQIKENCENEQIKNCLILAHNQEKDFLLDVLNFNSSLAKEDEGNLNVKLKFSSLIKETIFKTIFLNMELAKKINNL